MIHLPVIPIGPTVRADSQQMHLEIFLPNQTSECLLRFPSASLICCGAWPEVHHRAGTQPVWAHSVFGEGLMGAAIRDREGGHQFSPDPLLSVPDENTSVFPLKNLGLFTLTACSG